MKKLTFILVFLFACQAKAELYNSALMLSLQLQAESHSPAAVYSVSDKHRYVPVYQTAYVPVYEPVYWSPPPVSIDFGFIYSGWGWGSGGGHHGGHGGGHYGGHGGGHGGHR